MSQNEKTNNEKNSIQEFTNLKEKAENGDSQAQAYIGKEYFLGSQKVEQDYNEAFLWLKKSIEQGNEEGYGYIAHCYLNGLGVPENTTKALNYCKKSINRNCPYGFFVLGLIHYHGKGANKDYNEAFRLFENAADRGIKKAQEFIGYMYQYGQGVKQEYRNARKYYEMAAKQGSAFSFSKLGKLYSNGYGVDKDLAVALDWENKAIEKDKIYLINRAEILIKLSRYKEALVDCGNYYTNNTPSISIKDKKPWADFINNHLQNELSPEIKKANLRFIDFEPCYFIINFYESHTDNTNSYYGSYGSGYIAFTDKSIIIVGSAELSKKYPLYNSKIGLKLIGTFLGSFDYQKIINDNIFLQIEYTDIKNVYIDKNRNIIVEAAERISITSYYSQSEKYICAAIQAGRNDFFEHKSSTTINKTNNEYIIKLKQLKELYDNQILSQEEYEEKRNSILSIMNL